MTARTFRRAADLMLPVLLTLFLLLKSPQSAAFAEEAMRAALGKVLPVLIPYAILSRMILAALPASAGIGGRILTVYLAGAVCGAPVGAGLLGELTENGTLDKKTAGRLLPAVCHTSPAFCTAVVGQTVGSPALGAAIWCFSVLLAIPRLFLVLRCVKKSNREKKAAPGAPPPSARASGLGSAIRASAVMAGNVLCSILFFYTLAATVLSCLPPNAALAALLSSLLEVSSGVLAAGALPARACCCTAAFAAVFGGLCVGVQVRSAVHGVPILPYFLQKLTAGVASAVFFYAFSRFFGLFP